MKIKFKKIKENNISAILGIVIILVATYYIFFASTSRPILSALTTGFILGFGLNMIIFNKSISKSIINLGDDK